MFDPYDMNPDDSPDDVLADRVPELLAAMFGTPQSTISRF